MQERGEKKFYQPDANEVSKDLEHRTPGSSKMGVELLRGRGGTIAEDKKHSPLSPYEGRIEEKRGEVSPQTTLSLYERLRKKVLKKTVPALIGGSIVEL